ncbi:MAG: hypothetical protein ACLUNZ_02330 [Evtepia sp.]
MEAALCELAGELLKGAGADPQAARDAVLHTMACKAAIKGGQKNTREELLVVVREVMAGRVKYCPLRAAGGRYHDPAAAGASV